jgi:hypothetical protein
MIELKNNIMDYIKGEYTRTKWPYTAQNKLIGLFGPPVLTAIPLLEKDGLIRIAPGISSDIVIYLEGEQLSGILKINKITKKDRYGRNVKKFPAQN